MQTLLTTLRNRARIPVLVVSLGSLIATSGPIAGADFYWDPDLDVSGNSIDGTNLGGGGTWDLSAFQWWPVPAGALVQWPDTNADRAIFTHTFAAIPTLKSVTLGVPITANQLSFLRSGYSISAETITLAGANAGLHANLGESATIASVIDGVDGLMKTGGGSIRLTNAANSYTGATTIANGTLIIDSAAALGGAGTVNILTNNDTPLNTTLIGYGGGSLVLDGNAGGFTFARDIDFEGRGPIGDRGSAILSLGNNTLSGTLRAAISPLPLSPTATIRNSRINSVNGTLTLSGTVNSGGTAATTILALGGINQAGSGNFSFGGTGTLTGSGTIEKSGGGTLFLSSLASNAGFSGTIRVSGSATGQQSTVRVEQQTVGGNNIFGSNTGTGSSATIDMNGGVLEIRSDSNLTFGKNVYQRATSTLFTGPAVGGSAINGTTSFGVLHVASNTTFTFESRNGFGVTFVGNTTQENSNNNVTWTNNMGGTLLFTGNVWPNSDGTTARTLTIGGTGNTTINGNIAATGAGVKTLSKTGAGLLTILGNAAAAGVNGPTSIQGSLAITDFRSIADSNASTQTITLGNTTTTVGNLIIGTSVAANPANLTSSRAIVLNGTTVSPSIYANQTGATPVILNGTITRPAHTTGGLILGGTNTADNTINSVIPNAGVGGVTKVGTGTWVLAGANTYTGATTVTDGTLKIRDTFAGSSRNVLVDTSAFVFGVGLANAGAAGGIFIYEGAAGSASTETLGTLLPAGGAGEIRLVAGLGGTASLTFASIDATPNVTLTAPTTANTTITIASTLGLAPGMRVIGGSAAATITSITSGTQFVVSANQTLSSGAVLSFNRPNGGATINFNPGTGASVTIASVPAIGLLNSYSYFKGADFAYADNTVNALLRAPVYDTDAGFVTAGAALTLNSHNLVTGNTSTGAGTVLSLKISGNQTVTQTGLLTVREGAAGTSGGILVTGGTATISGTGVTTGGAADLIVRVNDGATLNLNAPVTATTTGGFTKTGGGTLVIGATNAYTTGGSTNLLEGTIQLTTGGRLSANSVNFNMRQGTVLDLNGISTSQSATASSIGAFNGTGTVTNSSATAVTFAVGGGTTGGSGTWNGTINESNGRISVVKMGTTNSQTWNGISNYTGSTTIGVAGTGTTGSLTVATLANIGVDSSIGRGDATSDATNAASLVFGGSTGGLIYSGNVFDTGLVMNTVSASTNRLFTISGTGATISSTVTNNNAIIWSNPGAIVFQGAGVKAFRLGGTSTGDNTFNPQITNNGADATTLTKVDAGQWNLGNTNNTYTGTTTVSNGILALNAAGALPTNSPLALGTTTTAGILQMSGTFARNLTTTPTAGTGTITWSGTTGGGGFAAHTTALTVTLNGGAGLTWGSGGFVGAGSLILNSASALSNVEFTNAIALNPGSVATPTVTTTNNSSIVTTADTSGLVIGQPISGPGIPVGAVIVSITDATTFVISANATTALGAGTGPASIGLATRTITVNDNANTGADFATLSGVLSGTGGGLLKIGSGILRVTGANTYTGTTEVQAGTLVVSSLGHSGDPLNTPTSVGVSGVAFGDTNAIVLGNLTTTGGILQYVGAGEVSDRKIRLQGTTAANQIHADGSGALILTNVAHDTTATGNKILSLRGTNTAGNMITSQLSNNGAGVLSVSVDGGATWILTNGSNDYTGNTTAGAGALGIGHNTALGAGTLILSNANVFAYGGDRTIANAVNHNNNTSSGFIGDYSLTFNGLLTLAATTSNVSTTTNSIVAGKTLTFNGGVVADGITATRAWAIDGSGETIINGTFTTATAFGINLSKTGDGTLVLGTDGANSNWNQAGNNVDVDRGTLKFTANNAIPSLAASGGLVISPELATADTATVDFNGTTQTVNSLTATSNGTLILDNTSGGNATFRFGANDSTVNINPATTGARTITDSGLGTLSIVKLGNTSTTFNLGMTLTYQGATRVEGGSLTIASTVDGTNALQVVNPGSTLALTGGITSPSAITSVVVENGGTLSLLDGTGNKLDSLTNLQLGSTGGTMTTLNLSVGDGAASGDGLNTDTLTLLTGGTLTLVAGNQITFNLTDIGLNALETYELLSSADGGFTSGPLLNTDYILGLTPSGFTSITLTATDTSVFITTGNLITGDLFWRGLTDTTWNGNLNNWSTDKAGAVIATNLPGPGTNVIFAWDNPGSGALTTTLEQNFRVNSLTFESGAVSTPSSVTIAPGAIATNRLEIAPQTATDGITLAAGGPSTVNISANLRLGADQTWSVASSATLTLSGSLTGTANLIKTGTGTTTLSGDFSGYSGAIDLQAGVLDIARTGTFAFSNLITSSVGGGALAKSGTGIMTLDNNSNTFTGPITLAGGTLAYTTIGNVGAVGTSSMGRPTNATEGTITSTANGVLSFVGTSAQSTDRAITSTAGVLTLSVNGDEVADTITYNGAITIGPTADGNQLILSGTAGREGIINSGFTQGGTTADVSVNGGTWTLSGASTVADDLIVSGVGTILNLNSTGALTYGASTSATLRVYSGATINLGANDAVTLAGFDGLRVGVDAGGAAVATFNMNGFNLSVVEFILGNRNADREGLIDGTGTLTVTGNLDLYEGTINANLASTGVDPFQKLGHETVTLRGNNSGLATTGAGDTQVEDGTLILDYTVQNNAKINTGNELNMLGGNLILNGNNSAVTTQTVTGLLLNTNSGGFSTITLNRGTGNNDIVLNLGQITRANSASDQVIRFYLPGGTQSATNGVTTTTPNSNYGTLGTGTTAANVAAYATVNDGTGTFFATGLSNGTNLNIVALASIAKNDVNTWAVDEHITDETTGFTGTLQSARINTLRFNAAGGSEVNMASDGVLLVRSGGILVTDVVTSGTPGIFGGTLVSDVTELIVHQDSSQRFEISSFIGSQQGITKSGNGTLLLSGDNNYDQETELQAGTVQVSGGNGISDLSIVSLAANRNTTLELLANETIGRLAGGKRTGIFGNDYGTVAIGEHTLRILNTSGTTYAGFFTGVGTLVKDGSADLNLQNTSTGFTGSIVIDSGTLRLSNAATIAATSITVNKGGSLFLDMSSTTRSTARILDTAPITLNSADGTQSARTIVRGLSIFNDQDGTADETVGVVNVNSGASYVGMSTGDANDDSDIIASSIQRFKSATLNVRGTALGSTDARNNQFRIVTANEAAFTAANLVGGGGAAGTQNISIVPWAIGETFTGAIGAEHMGNSLVTYIAGAGFRPLNFATEYDTIVSAAATDNARQSLTADLTGLTGKTINALVLDNANTAAVNVTGTGAGQALTVTSGAMLFTVSSPAAATNYSTTLGGFDSGIAVGGTNEYIFNVVNPNNEIAFGTGATATHSTRVTVASTVGMVVGQEIYGQGIPVGAVITQIVSATAIEISVPADIAFSSQTYRLSTMGRLTAVIGSDLTSAADITKSGRGTLDLRALTAAGGSIAGGDSHKTTINEGVLLIDSLENIGGSTGNLVFAGGVLFIDPTFTGDVSSRTITFEQGGGTLFSDIDLNFANSLGSGVGGFTKFGSGNLTLNAASTRTGFTNILGGGTVTVGATNALGIGGDVGIGAGSTLAIGVNNISIGRLRTFGIAPGGITGTGTITANNGYFFTHESGDVAVAAQLAGSGGLFKYEGGSITLTGANTYTGRTEVQIGTLTFNSIANVGGGASALGAPTNAEEGVIHTGFGTNAATLIYTGTGHNSNRGIQMNGTTGGLTINGNGTGALGLGSIQTTVTGNKTLTLRGTSDAALVNSVGAIREAGSSLTLNKTDANTWMVNGASAYTGATQIDNGILMIGVDDALPTATAVRIGTGGTAGTLDLNGFSQTIGSLTVQSTSNLVTNNIIVDTGETLTINGAVTLGIDANAADTNVNASGGGSIVVNSGGGNFIIGAATGGTNDSRVDADFSGLTNFTANLGAGIFRLGDVNTGTEVNPSTFKLAVNNIITASAIRVGDGAGGSATHTLTLGSGTNEFNSDTINIGSAGAAIRSSGAVVFDAGDTTGTLDIRASDGTGRAVINMVNTTGSTGGSIDSTLNLVGHTADILASTLTMASRTQNSGAATATLSFDQGLLDVTILNMASRTGAGTGGATATVNLGDSAAPGTPTVTIGAINMAVNTSGGGTVTADINVTGGNVSIGDGLNTGTAINMANAGAGRTATSNITLTGGNVDVTGDILRTGGAGTETATVTLNGATLDMNGNEIGTGAANINLVAQSGRLENLGELNGGAGLTKTTAGLLILEGTNGYTGGTTISAGTVQIGSGGSTGTIGGGDIANSGILSVDRDNEYTLSNKISGNGAFEQNGTGTTILTAGNDYTGTTTVNDGILLINGDQSAATGDVTVKTGATLGGTGIVGNLADTLIENGGTLTAGTVAGGVPVAGNLGTLTFNGDLNLESSSSIWLVDLVEGTGADRVNVGGLLTLNGATLDLNFGGTFTPHQVYTIATYGSGLGAGPFLSGTFDGLAEGATIGNYTISYGTGLSGGAITLTAVPEPGTFGLLGLALAGLAFLRFRKRRNEAAAAVDGAGE